MLSGKAPNLETIPSKTRAAADTLGKLRFHLLAAASHPIRMVRGWSNSVRQLCQGGQDDELAELLTRLEVAVRLHDLL
jgi:hypothetical protein